MKHFLSKRILTVTSAFILLSMTTFAIFSAFLLNSALASTVVRVTNITISTQSISLGERTSQPLTANIIPSNASNRSVTWSSSVPDVASVNESGVVTANKAGTAIITATTADGGFSDICIVTVIIPVTGIRLNVTAHSIPIRSTFELIAEVLPSEASNKNLSWSSSHPSIVNVNSNGMVTALSAGTAIITVTTQEGDFTADSFITSKVVDVQTVTINQPLTTTVSKFRTLQLTARISPENATDQRVSWTSEDSQIATVSQGGLVTALEEGNVVIEAKAGNSTSTIQLNVEETRVTGVSVSPVSATMGIGATTLFGANIQPPNASNTKTSWSTSNDRVARVNENGLVTAVSPGTAIITATTEDGGKKASANVNVIIPVTGITVTPNSQILSSGATQQLNMVISPANATNRNVSWTSSNNAVATVSNAGLVRAIALGIATITVTTEDGGHTASAQINVGVRVTTVTIAPLTPAINVGATQQLSATVNPSNATDRRVIWTSGDTSIATVSDTGLVTGVGGGIATITATTVDGGRTATSRVTVNVIAVTGVTLAPATINLNAGTTQQLTATIAPPNATNRRLTFSSSNTQVASVSDTGLVFAVGAGTATITATTQDGNRTATSAVTVTVIPVTAVSITPASSILNAGVTQQLTATITPPNATDRRLTWMSSNLNVATVSATGLVTAIRAGVATITATTPDGTRTAVSIISVAGGQIDPNLVTQPIFRDRETVMNVGNTAVLVFSSNSVTGDAPVASVNLLNAEQERPLLENATRQGLSRLSGIIDASLTNAQIVNPVTISINYNRHQLLTGRVPALFVFNERSSRWVFIGGNVTDSAVSAFVNRFSYFAVFSKDPLPLLQDISGHWGERQIRTMAGMGIIEGFADGTFRPNRMVTRAEFAAILTRANSLAQNAQVARRFRDSNTFSWATGFIGAAVNAGLLGGFEDNTFRANQGITRAEVAVIADRMLVRNLARRINPPREVPTFTDNLPAWAKSAISSSISAGFLQGFEDNTFRSSRTATRAEIAAILYRIFAQR